MGIKVNIVQLLKISALSFMTWYDLSMVMTVPRRIDPSLAPMLNEFIADAASHGVQVRPWTLGALEYDGSIEYPTLAQTLVPEFFSTKAFYVPSSIKVQFSKGPYSYEFFRLMLYHELGHALLRLDHDSYNEFNIMDPAINVMPTPEEWARMVDTLFQDGKEKLK